MSLKIVVFLLFSVFGKLYSEDVEDVEMGRIFNGERTTIEEFPHTVYINKNDAHHCGGSIISEDIILTAAHCLTNIDLDEITISVGTSDCIEVIDEYKLEDFVVHEKFKEDILKNDIAVLKLKRPLKFRKTVQPIKLVKPGDEIPEGKVVRTAGCGTIDERGHSRDAKKLLSATLRALSEEECADKEPKFNAETLICLRDDKEHQSVCHGDSGSGFIVDGKLAGVVSYGPKVCGESPLSGATKVSMFIKWIQDTIKKLNGKPATVFGGKPADTPKPVETPKPDCEKKKEPKEIIKIKPHIDSDEESSSEESSSESESDSESGSDSESSESNENYGRRVIRENEDDTGAIKRSIHQMIFRMKLQYADEMKNIQKSIRNFKREFE